MGLANAAAQAARAIVRGGALGVLYRWSLSRHQARSSGLL